MYTWTRYHGYEVSTRGDARFSALNATMPDGRTIEHHYQCDIKGYDPGGRNWRLGKGKPPLHECDLWELYLDLWRQWAHRNPHLMRVLAKHEVLCDRFASTEINQARALATILNENLGSGLFS